MSLKHSVYESMIGTSVCEYPHESGFTIAALDNDTVSPELQAALGATLSRDPAPLKLRANEITPEKTERIIGRYFREYGHSSVGEMGNLFFSIEGISMVDAVRTICFPRFFGQEASTRYIDFSQSQYVLPSDLREKKGAHRIMGGWFDLYQEVLDILMKHFTSVGNMSKKTAKPKAFDIAGGFLPIAAKTSVVVCGNIRNLIEHCWEMQSHIDSPLTQEIGNHLLEVIDDRCPNSVKHRDHEEIVNRNNLRNVLHNDTRWHLSQLRSAGPIGFFQYFDTDSFCAVAKNVFDSRLPDNLLGRYGTIRAQTEISFRSLRDVLRHRPFAKTWRLGNINTPSDKLFSQWYVDQIPEDSRDAVKMRVNDLISDAYNLEEEYHNQIYLLPMGSISLLEMAGNIDKWLYFLRLRSGITVHPELREVVHCWIQRFATQFAIPPDHFGNMLPNPDYSLRAKDA